jgi:hypothetical protein
LEEDIKVRLRQHRLDQPSRLGVVEGVLPGGHWFTVCSNFVESLTRSLRDGGDHRWVQYDTAVRPGPINNNSVTKLTTKGIATSNK